MKVLVIYPGYAKYNYDLFSTLNKLTTRGNHEVRIIFIRKERKGESFFDDFTNSKKFQAQYLNLEGIRITDYDLKSFLHLGRVLLTLIHKSNVVFTSTQAPVHSKVALMFSKMLRKRFVVFVEQWRELSNAGILMKIYKRLDELVLIRATSVLVHGKAQMNFVKAISSGIQVFEFPFTSRIDDSKVKDNSVKNNEDPVRFVYYGRITERKGLDILISAFKEIKQNARLEIYGGVDKQNFVWEAERGIRYLAECKELAKGDKRITFHGAISPNKKHVVFSETDVFIHPHKEFMGLTEGWGLVLNEAMLSGIPVIATSNVGSAHTLIKDGYNGFIIEPSNVVELRDRMEWFIHRPHLIRKFGDRCFEVIRDYQDARIMYRTLEKLLD